MSPPRDGFNSPEELLSAMRVELRTAAKKAHEWTLKRDRLIREMHAAGVSLRAIGEASGLTHAGVAKIVKRELPPQTRKKQ